MPTYRTHRHAPARAALACAPPGEPLLPLLWMYGLHEEVDSLSFDAAPSIDVGLPVSRMGAQGLITWKQGNGSGPFTVQLYTGLHAAAGDLGIPGPGLGSTTSIPLTVRVGPFGLSYEPIAYLDTRRTSQTSGAFTFLFAGDLVNGMLRFENDFFSPFGGDEFRTGALELHTQFHTARIPWGLGVEMRAWTASTRGLEPLGVGETYDLTGQLGDGYSHGVLCLAVNIKAFRLCAGWDAEGIRNAVQNEFVHAISGDGIVPVVDRRPQPYLRISLNPGPASY